jgi:type IV secretory pathway ATPase VirB11/archaellum biosynthesis ATPase
MSENPSSKNGKVEFEDDGVTYLPRTDADKGREPEFVSSRLGTRRFSVKALIERVVSAFNEEHGEESPAYLEANTPTKRLKLLRDVVDYVLAVESIQVSQEDKAELIGKSYSELYSYGALDALFRDETITTISLDGVDKVFVRYGHGELTPLKPLFEDSQHLREVIRRLVRDAGAELREDEPILEVGLTVEDRLVSVNLVTPPVTIQLSADIRVHPKTLPTLDELIESKFLIPKAAEFLRALTESPHGFVIVGDTESGKTTLLSVIAQILPNPEGIISVERAGELRLPKAATRLVTRWPVGDKSGVSFGEQIQAALEKNPACILLDEVRADEPQHIAPLLQGDTSLRQIWTFRGPVDPNKLRSALGMVARRAEAGQGEALVHALYRRLPFVITVKRAQGRIELRNVAEWQYPEGAEYPDFVMLMEKGWEGVELTGKHPSRNLDLPSDFWE